jgi:hypothetical protein
VEPPRPTSTPGAVTPGWHPDPSGRFEYRYHNGMSWTADVATGGQRYVDTVHTAPVPPAQVVPGGRTGNGIATAALTCGIISLALGWIPVVFALGLILAVLAVVFGVVGLRRARAIGHGRGFAIAGLLTGSLGVLVAIGGLVFTVVVYRAIERFENPAAHVAAIEQCSMDDRRAVAIGSLRNASDHGADFTVVVEFRRPASGVLVSSSRVRLDDVAPAASVPFEVSRLVTVDDIDCVIAEVTGPLPFGVVPR